MLDPDDEDGGALRAIRHAMMTNGLNYCPYYSETNRSDGKSLILHPIESIAVHLSFDWHQAGKYCDGLIAEKLNGYVVTLPDGTTRHFRTKRLQPRGGPQQFTRDSVRELLMRVFYTGRVPYFGTTEHGTKSKRYNPTLLQDGSHPSLVTTEVFERCQEIRKRMHRKPHSLTTRTRTLFPVTSKLFCGECGSHLIRASLHGIGLGNQGAMSFPKTNMWLLSGFNLPAARRLPR
ncbi:MAG: recombinase family protein [Chloroflexi bacterium]|nr:recombinase family protein [Chloroflexota bacterium]